MVITPYHSTIILGGAQLGLCYGVTNRRFLSRPALYELLDKARYLGFHSFDLAQAYGSAEERVAMWRQARFDRSLKFGSKLQLAIGNRCSQQKRLRRSCARLGGLDYVLLHSVKQEQFQMLRTLCPNQKIGLSLYNPSELEKLFAKKRNFQVLQIPYSAADRRFEPYFSRLVSSGVELQLRSLYLQGLLFVNDIDPYVTKYPALTGLAPLLARLGDMEQGYSLQRQDIVLYAGLRHTAQYPSLKLVLGLSCATELLQLHHSLLRIAKWSNKLRTQVSIALEQLPLLGPKIVVPTLW